MCYSALVYQSRKDLEDRYFAHTVREQIEAFDSRSKENPKLYPAVAERIYPGHYAPVIYDKGGRRVLELMRYSAYFPPYAPKAFSSFNARRDNLTSPYWKEAVRNHGFIVLKGFYEWVNVADLLKAGIVKIDDVKADFARQAEERKQKILSSGKKYKPTPTELKDPRFRRIVIEFKPEDGEDLIVPVIFNQGDVFEGFALITDEPPREIAEAGHDRCPIILDPKYLDQWLGSSGINAEIDSLLTHRKRTTFRHWLAPAA
jgi:putative SOS response-associated peptidase YedK